MIEATTIESFSTIKDDLSRVSYAYHLCELIDALCPENQEQDNVFFLLRKTLNNLAEKNSNQQSASLIYKFELDLLTILGYWNQSDIVSKNFDTRVFIESIIERKLKSHDVFAKLQ